MVERKTNMFLQTKIPSKKPDVVAMAARRLLVPYNDGEFKNEMRKGDR